MRKSIILSLLAIWFISGIGGTFYIYDNIIHPDETQLKNDLAWIKLKSKSGTELLNNLTNLFANYPGVAIIVLSEKSKKILGSLYEPERTDESTYRSTIKDIKKYSSVHPLYNIHTFTISKTYVIQLFFVKNITYPHTKSLLYQGAGFIKKAVILYQLLLIILLVALVFSKKEKKNKESDSDENYEQEEDFQVFTEVTSTEKDSQLGGQARTLLQVLENYFPLESLGIYFYDEGGWHPEVYKKGGIYINNDFSDQVMTQLNSMNKNSSSMISFNNEIDYIIPFFHRMKIIGAVHLKFFQSFHFSSEQRDKLMDTISSFSHSVFLHKVYEVATVDMESGFHTYPYFYFTLKEKLKSTHNFAVFIFEITRVERFSPGTIHTWGNSLMSSLLREKREADIYARLERGKFALLYDIETDSEEHKSGGVKIQDLDKVPQVIKTCTDSILKDYGQLNGGVFIRPMHMDNAETFIKRLDYIIINSRISGETEAFFTGVFDKSQNQETGA